MSRSVRILIVLAALVAAGLPARASDPSCIDYAPFSHLPDATMTAQEHLSNDGVAYVRYRGFAPAFDGMPASVDVTIPCDADGPMPLVVMNHGWTDDKEIWQETGRSDTVGSEFRRGSNHHWNNIWFASRGYAVLNHTHRGWHDSCGPRAPGATPLLPAEQCRDFEGFIHMGDQRWEVRDAQWLTAALVDSGVADPDRLAVTGGSYGGGITIQAALLNDRIRCGGAPQLHGADPCAGAQDGEYAPWTTLEGEPLRWRAAVPMYTWSDVIQVLLPNGRGSDDAMVPHAHTAEPVGVPIASYLAGLYAAGQPLGNGYYALPGHETADITLLTLRTLAGNPFPYEDPLVAHGIEQFQIYKSAVGIEPNGVVPIFWVQGLTDPLFTAIEAVQTANVLRAFDADYPISMFFGDLGHDYAAERIDEWDAAKEAMNAFLDHHVLGVGDEPPTDVTAAITRCYDPDAPMRLERAPAWSELWDATATFTSEAPGASSSVVITEGGLATDPVTTATVPGPQSYRGCRIMSPARPDPNAVTYEWTLDTAITMLGGPAVELDVVATAPDVPVSVRLWDVTPDGDRQALVTRGVYRLAGAGAATIRFQIAPQGYTWEAGHRIKLEVTANDWPYRQHSNLPGALLVTSTELVLPVVA